MAKIFTNIIDTASPSADLRSNESKNWFREQARRVRTLDTNKLLIKSRENTRARILTGQMHMFAYDPKHASTLPYYDRFPLVFPFKKLNDGFLGINLHYLPLILRAKLMDALYDLVNNTSYDETTRLRLSYELLDRSSKFRYFKPCVKHYLNNMIDSRIIFIHPDEWEIALFLPLHRFRNATTAQVHKDSRNKITRR